jgi:mannose-6-phosphate isomerase-like protein (cupin superfamily)
MIENITKNGVLLAIIISHRFRAPGVHFFTPDHLSQQIAYMNHPAGKEIVPHIHNLILREVQYTQEVLMIRRGKLRVDFYDHDREYFTSRILEEGDTVLLAAGGHGFEVLEDVEMIEVKQGPHAGEQDKARIEGVDKRLLRVEG